MPSCQAYGCANETGRTKRQEKISYYRFPDPTREKGRAERWLHNIGTGYKVSNFKFAEYKVVCSDHFHENCFKRNLQAELLDYIPKQRRLKDGAIPTKFSHKTFDVINIDGESVSSRTLNRAARKRLLKNNQQEVAEKLVCIEDSETNHLNSCSAVGTEPMIDEILTKQSTKDFSQQVFPEDLDFLDIMNISSSTALDCEHQDESFVPNSTLGECSDESLTEQPIDIVEERKFVIYESQLDILLENIFLSDGSLSIAKFSSGTNISIKVKSSDDKCILNWSSQPKVGKFYGFNLLICSSVVFSGETYESIKKPLEFAGLQFVNQNTFYKIQRTLVVPSIDKMYKESITTAREESKSDSVVLGDGRFDSPGKCAKYCTYSFQSPTTNKVIATSTVQTSKGKGSSPLELVGFKECVDQLEKQDFKLSTIATDRNKQISKWLREQRPTIKHRYDPWHFAKNIKGKLRPLAKRKGCKIINEWIKPIGNHLFFCAQNCDSNPEKLIEMWKSLLHHISNRHKFSRVYKNYKKCAHKNYTKKESQRKKWIAKDSAAYHQIEKVILDKRNLGDMPKLADPYHTGKVEVFNSVVNMYACKRKEFDINIMDARVKLAAIDYNINSNREQDTITKQRRGSGKVGEKKWKFQVAKQSKEWIAKEVKAKKSHSFVYDLLREVVALKLSGISVDVPSSEIEYALKSPKNIAATERPDTNDIVTKRKQLGRFGKK